MITVAVLVRARCHYVARIRRMCATNASPKAYQSSAATLPLEIIEMIIAPLTCDVQSLRACSLTCSTPGTSLSFPVSTTPLLAKPITGS